MRSNRSGRRQTRFPIAPRAERGPDGDGRAERVRNRVDVARSPRSGTPMPGRSSGRAAEVEPHLRPGHERRERGELVPVVRQAVREDGDGLALALDLAEQGRVVVGDLGHGPNLPKADLGWTP